MGNQNGANAGITGIGRLPTSPRFYAGTTPDNMNNAPFRVLDNGKMYATNAEISGKITASEGQIAGFEIRNGRLTSEYTTGGWVSQYDPVTGRDVPSTPEVTSFMELLTSSIVFKVLSKAPFRSQILKISGDKIILNHLVGYNENLVGETIIEAGKITLKDSNGNTQEITATSGRDDSSDRDDRD